MGDGIVYIGAWDETVKELICNLSSRNKIDILKSAFNI